MFDSRHTSTESNDTRFNPGSTRDADFAAPLPDAGALLAAGWNAGPRDPRSSRLTRPIRRGRLNRERGGLSERVKGEGIERDRFPFANPMS